MLLAHICLHGVPLLPLASHLVKMICDWGVDEWQAGMKTGASGERVWGKRWMRYRRQLHLLPLLVT